MSKWLILLSVLAASAGAAPVWTWVDANGQVHYSDRPEPGARQIDLPGSEPGSSSAPAQQPSAVETPSAAPGATTQPQVAVRYRTLDVQTPAQQETLWNIGGTLEVQIAIAPALQPGHRLDVYLDGARRNLDTTSTQFTVPDVFRGTHSLQAVVIDGTGREILRSQSVQFVVQQTSILNPSNPNAPARAQRAPNAG
jgi:hypothetical protein